MKHITIAVPDGKLNLNTISGAYDILCRADEYWQELGNKQRLHVQVAGFVREVQSHNNYLAVHPADLSSIKKTDLVLVPAFLDDYAGALKNNQKLIDWIRRQYESGAEIASMCSGSFLLAATGLLNGKTCSVHWNKAEMFRQMFPQVNVATGRIITNENRIYTNGGAYSFLNLVVYLTERYFDRQTAIFCSKVFQIEPDRQSQSEYIIFSGRKSHSDEMVLQAQTYIENNLCEKISFEDLSCRLAVGRRNFDRRFIKATGTTPVEYAQMVKIESAKAAFERTRKTINEVMYEVGYSDIKSFRELFKKLTGMSPLEYKTKYNREALPARSIPHVAG